MSAQHHPSDLELAALISSKICHDVIGPVGAINNGLEILDDDETVDTQNYALEVIRNVTKQASSRLQFARFAFGAAGSAGSSIELDMARDLAIGFVGDGKHRLTWDGPSGYMGKDYVKLVLNLVASAVTALPRGGSIDTIITGTIETPMFKLTCQGKGVRKPNFLTDLVGGSTLEEIDSMSIQAYYTWRLATQANMDLSIEQTDDAIILTAMPRA